MGPLVALETLVEEGDALCAEQMEEAKYFVNELRDINEVEVGIMPNDDSFHELIFVPPYPPGSAAVGFQRTRTDGEGRK